MLMAGVYEGNTDEQIAECGFNNREEIEQEGPTRLAESLIVSIKEFAVKKIEIHIVKSVLFNIILLA